MQPLLRAWVTGDVAEPTPATYMQPLSGAWVRGDGDKAAQPQMDQTSPIGMHLTKDHVADIIKWLLSSESGELLHVAKDPAGLCQRCHEGLARILPQLVILFRRRYQCPDPPVRPGHGGQWHLW